MLKSAQIELLILATQNVKLYFFKRMHFTRALTAAIYIHALPHNAIMIHALVGFIKTHIEALYHACILLPEPRALAFCQQSAVYTNN
jgi:hypothetical protein